MKIKKGDFIILFILILAIVLYLFLNNNRQIGKRAVIKIDNEIYKEIYLNNNLEKEENIILEDEKYIKIIYDKYGVYVSEVACPDKVCQKTGKIIKTNQSIICLPNKVIIYID